MLKIRAAEEGVAMKDLAARVLREGLAREPGRNKSRPMKWTTFKGKGLRPGIDLNDRESVWDVMDGRR